MKNKIIALLLITSLAFAPSCKKTETTTRDYASFHDISVPIYMHRINPATAQLLIDTVAGYRTQYLNQLELAYPGLNATMTADWQAIIQTTDSATQQTLLQNFDNSYHAKTLLVFNSTGISLTDISARYQAVLGTTPFSVGEFGQVTVLENSAFTPSEPAYPEDSSYDFNGFSLFRNQTEGCGLLAGNSITNANNYCEVRMSAAIAGGCNTTTVSGDSIALPNLAFKYFTSSFTLQGPSHLSCLAGAFGGGASATATLSAHVELNGSNQLSRDVLSISTVVTIAGYAHEERIIPAGTIIPIAINNDAGLPAGIYKAYTRTDNTALSGGASGCSSESIIHKYKTLFRMTQ